MNHSSEFLDGWYGGMAQRDSINRHIWHCWDADYSWDAVVDDFGNLYPITDYVSSRDY